MKLLKLTMLAATAAVAASAFIGASSASAVSHKWIALCNAQTLNLCPTANLIKHELLGKALLLQPKPGEFNAGFVTVKCPEGHGETNAIQSQQEQSVENTATVPTTAFLAKLEFLKFTGCTGCTGVAVAPAEIHLWMKTGLADDWRLTALNAKVTFSGCPFGVSCTYKGNLEFIVQMDAEGAFGDPEGKEFELSEGGFGCAAVGKWTTGRTRIDWKLDDANGTIHTKIWPTLLENLTLH
jgi:hypothetical protein